jgi:hypothetical protein
VPIRTEHEFDNPPTPIPASPTAAPVPAPIAAAPIAQVPHQERALALLTTCHQLAQIDGQIDPSEIEVSVRAVMEHTGVPDGPLLREAFDNGSRRDITVALEQLKAGSDRATAIRLLRSWIAVARADQRIHPAEHELLQRWAVHMGLSNDFLEGMLES